MLRFLFPPKWNLRIFVVQAIMLAFTLVGVGKFLAKATDDKNPNPLIQQGGTIDASQLAAIAPQGVIPNNINQEDANQALAQLASQLGQTQAPQDMVQTATSNIGAGSEPSEASMLQMQSVAIESAYKRINLIASIAEIIAPIIPSEKFQQDAIRIIQARDELKMMREQNALQTSEIAQNPAQ